MQVPNDTLREMPIGFLNRGMAKDFQIALKWHMERYDTKVVDLARDTGVTRDVINKLLRRENASTDVENAILIAAYYGKSVNEFITLRDADETSQTRALLDLLSPEARRLLDAQIRGLVYQGRETS
jgi:plasmid maintenance system antidote protein VapI